MPKITRHDLLLASTDTGKLSAHKVAVAVSPQAAFFVSIACMQAARDGSDPLAKKEGPYEGALSLNNKREEPRGQTTHLLCA